jgi:NADPH:quinone reductase-like Zn-dependent oxidoreductase
LTEKRAFALHGIKILVKGIFVKKFKAGDRVHIIGGAWIGYTGTFSEEMAKSAIPLAEIQLDQAGKVHVPLQMVAALDPANDAKLIRDKAIK